MRMLEKLGRRRWYKRKEHQCLPAHTDIQKDYTNRMHAGNICAIDVVDEQIERVLQVVHELSTSRTSNLNG